MNRYHCSIYIPIDIKEKLNSLTDRLNTLKWRYTPHSIDNIKNRCYDIGSMLKFINALILSEKDIFEVYSQDNIIDRVCYRIEYITCDIILVIDNTKTIITIYANSKNDNHITLKETLYVRG